MLILICPANAPELQWMSDVEKFLETVGNLVNDAAGCEDAVKPMKASFPRHFGACLCLSCLGADRVSARLGLEMQFTCVAIRFCFACARFFFPFTIHYKYLSCVGAERVWVWPGLEMHFGAHGFDLIFDSSMCKTCSSNKVHITFPEWLKSCLIFIKTLIWAKRFSKKSICLSQFILQKDYVTIWFLDSGQIFSAICGSDLRFQLAVCGGRNDRPTSGCAPTSVRGG